MIDNLVKNKKVALVFSDPAGAKAMIAISKKYTHNDMTILLSDRSYPFYKDMNADVIIIKDENDFFLALDSFNPQVILTGTSMPVSIELKGLRYAKKNNIQSASFIDHWTNIKMRFIDKDDVLILPDAIFVINQKAYDLAIKDELPEQRLSITSNPYYEWLASWRPDKDRAAIYALLKLEQDKQYIVYAPEPLAKFNLDVKYGFNEYDGLKEIDQVISAQSQNSIKKTVLVYKLHPNVTKKEVYNSIKLYLGIFPEYIKIVSNIDLNHLAYYSSGVFGFFSNSLIETSRIGVPVYRVVYKLMNIEDDPLLGLDIGEKVDSYKKLNEVIYQILNK